MLEKLFVLSASESNAAGQGLQGTQAGFGSQGKLLLVHTDEPLQDEHSEALRVNPRPGVNDLAPRLGELRLRRNGVSNGFSVGKPFAGVGGDFRFEAL